ncbi:MAG: chromosome partitioning protein, partial [Candidatus Nanopelagicales bacterium]
HSNGVRVVGITSETDSPSVGVDAVLPPDVERVCAALRGGKAAFSTVVPSSEPDRMPTGRLIAVWAPIGSPGRTSIAVGLADESARLNVSTLLADADTYGPSIAQQLGLLDDSSGVAAACRLAGHGRLDVAGVAKSAVALPSSLQVLTGIPRADRWDELRPAALDVLWQQCREVARATVVDVGFCVEHDDLSWLEPGLPSRNQATTATLAAADVVVAVTGADPVALVRFIRDVPAVKALAPTALFEVVVNRAPSGREAMREVRELLLDHLGMAQLTFVYDAPEPFAACRRSGLTLSEVAPRAEVRKQIRTLAASLVGVQPPRKRRRAA